MKPLKTLQNPNMCYVYKICKGVHQIQREPVSKEIPIKVC